MSKSITPKSQKISKSEATATRRSQRRTRFLFDSDKNDETSKINLSSEGSDEPQSVYRAHKKVNVEESLHKKTTKVENLNVEVGKIRSTKANKKPPRKTVFSNIKARSSPRWLTSVLKAATSKQKELIHEIGFGPLLEWFKFDTVPLKLGNFVVKSFDPENCRIKLADGRAIKVTKLIIHDILGLPITDYSIDTYNPSRRGPEVIDEFKEYLKVNPRERMIVNGLHDWMTDYIDGDRWYKLAFVAYVTTLLIECSSNGSINESIIPYVDCNEVDVLHFDWCGYILDAIVRTTTNFKPTKHFDGPLLILVLIYVHCTTVGDDEVVRSYPGIKDWNSDNLNARENEELQNGGFGLNDVRIIDGYEEVLIKSIEELSDTRGTKRKACNEEDIKSKVLEEMDDSAANYVFKIGDECLRASKLKIKQTLESARKHKAFIDKSIACVMSNNPFDPELLELAAERNSVFDVSRVLKKEMKDVGLEYVPDSDYNIASPRSHHVKEIGQSSKMTDSPFIIVDTLGKSPMIQKPDEGISKNSSVDDGVVQESIMDVDGQKRDVVGDEKVVEVPSIDEPAVIEENKSEEVKVSGRDEVEVNISNNLLKQSTPGLIECKQKGKVEQSQKMKQNKDFPIFDVTNSPDSLHKSKACVFEETFQDSALFEVHEKQSEDKGCVVDNAEVKSVGQPFTKYEDYLHCQATDLITESMQVKKIAEKKLMDDHLSQNQVPSIFAPFPTPSSVGSAKVAFASPSGHQTTEPKMRLDLQKNLLATQENTKALSKETTENKEDSVVEKTVEVEVEGNTEIVKISDDLFSAYIGKEVCMHSKMTVQEERVCTFVFSAFQPIKRVYFKNYASVLNLRSLESLYVGMPVCQSIVDVWTQILNYEEALQESTDDCGRVFCDTEAVTYEAINPNVDQTLVTSTFEKCLKSSIQQVAKENLRETTLVFFPIIRPMEHKNQTVVNHYYVICFNLKVPSIYIIDSIKEKSDLFAVYGNLPNTLRRMFCEYLGKVERHEKTVELMTTEIKILDVNWATRKNVTDSGVYAMRHMECYKGTSVSEFKTDFNTLASAQKTQIECLRKKYLVKILLGEFNDYVQSVKDAVRNYEKLDKELRIGHKKHSKSNIGKRLFISDIISG